MYYIYEMSMDVKIIMHLHTASLQSYNIFSLEISQFLYFTAIVRRRFTEIGFVSSAIAAKPSPYTGCSKIMGTNFRVPIYKHGYT